jgi:hypothetical protein
MNVRAPSSDDEPLILVAIVVLVVTAVGSVGEWAPALWAMLR